MSRVISDDMPEEIRYLIDQGWGDMKSFSVSVGIPYTTVYSVLVRAGHRHIDTIYRLARACPTQTNLDTLINMLVIPNVVRRRARVEALLDGVSISEWGRRSGVTQPRISQLLSLENVQLTNFASIAKALGVTAEELFNAYAKIAA